MITSNYKILARLTVTHTYFEKEVCPGLTYLFDSCNEKIMNRFGFRLRHWANGFDLFVNTSQPVPQYLNYITNSSGLTSFDFLILNSHIGFFSFTDLPLDWVGQLVYNSSNSTVDSETGKIRLTAELSGSSAVNALARIKISFKDLLQAEGASGYPDFEIQFTSRATQWQYYVINKSSHGLENIDIVSKSAITFQKQGKTVLPTGEEAVWFSSSEQLIPFSEKPKYKFDLVSSNASDEVSPGKKRSGTVRTIFKSLPNPSPSRMTVQNSNGRSQAVSPMYIYV